MSVRDLDRYLNGIKTDGVAVLNSQRVNDPVSEISQGFLVVVHPHDSDLLLPPGFDDSPCGSHRIAHIAADEPGKIRMLLENLLRKLI